MGAQEMENADSVERTRRRQLIGLLTSFGIPVILMFGVVDYLEGDTIEFLVDVTLVAILVAGLVAIFKYNKDRPAYFIGLNMLALAVLYNVAIGAGKESALYWVFLLPSLLFFFQGRRDGLISVGFVLLLLSLLLFQPGLVHAHDYGLKTGLRFFPSFFFVAVIGYGLESSRYRFSEYAAKGTRGTSRRKGESRESPETDQDPARPAPHVRKLQEDQGRQRLLEADRSVPV